MFLVFVCVFCGIADLSNAQSIQKIEKAHLYIPELIIEDSLILNGIDSLIFHSICPEIKTPNEKVKIFNVISKQKDRESFNFLFNLQSGIQLYDKLKLQGCFEYKDYLFLWFDDVPIQLLSISNKKRKLTYTKGVPIFVSDLATFSINYINNDLTLVGICCF
jgi:hypothetical protein